VNHGQVLWFVHHEASGDSVYVIDLKDEETGTVTVRNTATQLLIAASAVGMWSAVR
jgi:hypothetical protein